MLANEDYAPENPEILCVSIIIFVLKFENDFNLNFKVFFHFVLNEMKLNLKEIHSYEVKIIKFLPNYFLFLPTFKNMIEAILKIVYGRKNYQNDLIELEMVCINKYITTNKSISFATLIVDTVMERAKTQEKFDMGYDKVRAVFVVNHITFV